MNYDIDPELIPLITTYFPEFSFADPVASRAKLAELGQPVFDIDTSGLLIEDHRVPVEDEGAEIGVRVYRPENPSSAVPGLLYIHGGGFVYGSVDFEHPLFVSLSRELGIAILAVEYRLAPECPYPGALNDCYAALQWAAANAEALCLDPRRLGVMGMSAGGCLAAALSLLARDRGGPSLCFQYLGIPVLDDRQDSWSIKTFIDTPVIDAQGIAHCWEHYLRPGLEPGADDVPCYAAPARAQDLSGLPPAYISVMEFDPLRDEGIAYALQLLRSGVSVELHSFPRTFHGSGVIPGVAVSQREQQEMRDVLSRGLGL